MAMADLLSFLRECAASGALIGSICGLLIVPFLTWLAVRALAPRIHAMANDAPWQAPLAAAAASAPAAVFLALAISGLIGASSAGCLNYAWGRALFAGVLVLTTSSVARAIFVACRRIAQVRNLIAASGPADAHVETIAKRCNVRVRLLPYSEPLCALAGILRPVVLLSRGALERLADEELEAALRHERAHAIRLDLVLAMTLSFFADLLPFPARDFATIYAVAREKAADLYAIQVSAPEVLASAIIALASTRRPFGATAALAGDLRSVTDRVRALLAHRVEQAYSLKQRTISTAWLSAIILAGLAPSILAAMNYYACTIKGMHT